MTLSDIFVYFQAINYQGLRDYIIVFSVSIQVGDLGHILPCLLVNLFLVSQSQKPNLSLI